MRIHRLLLASAIPLLWACAAFENSGPRVTLSVSSQPIDLALGDTARISITVRNVGSRAVSVGSQGCNQDFFISDMDGNAYTPAEAVYCTLELKAPVELLPGRSYQIDAFTTGRAIRQDTQDAPGLLAPGQYRIRPFVSVLSGDESAVIVSSDPILVIFR